jgi:hypothetical protein
MGHESAVPGLAPRAASTALDTGLGKHGDRSITDLGLPANIIATLTREGVRTLQDWHRLGQRRYELWGITRAAVRQIDRAAREADQ